MTTRMNAETSGVLRTKGNAWVRVREREGGREHELPTLADAVAFGAVRVSRTGRVTATRGYAIIWLDDRRHHGFVPPDYNDDRIGVQAGLLGQDEHGTVIFSTLAAAERAAMVLGVRGRIFVYNYAPAE